MGLREFSACLALKFIIYFSEFSHLLTESEKTRKINSRKQPKPRGNPTSATFRVAPVKVGKLIKFR